MQNSDRWLATWIGSIIPAHDALSPAAMNGFVDQTLRQAIFTSVGGNSLRLTISNRYGEEELTVAGVAIGAKARPDSASMIEQSIVRLTFGGEANVIIPRGAEVMSDPVAANLLPHQTLFVDMYLPKSTGSANFNRTPSQTSYVAAGDRVANVTGDGFEVLAPSWFYITALDVQNPEVSEVIAACADSLSHQGPQIDSNTKWPQLLSRRLQDRFGEAAPSVVQSTMSGQRLLTTSPWGPHTLARFEREILGIAGITRIILLVGINDLTFPHLKQSRQTGLVTERSVEEMMAGYEQLAKQAHAHGLPISICTISPNSGFSWEGQATWSPAAEGKRKALNEWFRSSGNGLFDGMFDFAAAVENRLNDAYFDPSYSADGIHPNSAGQYMFAQAVDIDMLLNLTASGFLSSRRPR